MSGLEAVIGWAVVLLAAEVASDVDVRTGSVAAALEAGALTFVSRVATGVGAYAGLRGLAAHVSASTTGIVDNVLAMVGLASGAYGAVEAGCNGTYASAAVGPSDSPQGRIGWRARTTHGRVPNRTGTLIRARSAGRALPCARNVVASASQKMSRRTTA
ncbi:MAG: hypothetical protein KatS3mg077_3070 [Candidatus Binatia bacterium]|nr:MAG: hypothetical protein KatS3mg077_3070 [Candidatus Binatia bacterium]